MATTIETDLKELLGDIQKELREIRCDLNDLKVSQAEIKGDLNRACRIKLKALSKKG